jgi:MoaA/NifB/PqqE/SkfB family radical SAM enzyme
MAPRNPAAEGLPRELYMEVTNRCNSRCQTCIRTFELLEPLRHLTLAELQAIVDQFPGLERVVLHGIGESLLNPELAAMIRYVKDQHPSAVVLFNSNAVLLDEDWQRALMDAGLDEFRVSLDAATAATYARIRGIDAFDIVIENVRRFASLLRNAGRPRLSFWLTAMIENLSELPALVDLAAEIGVPEVYVQRLVLIQRGLARAEQSLYRQLRTQEEAALAEADERAIDHGLAFRASGLVSPQESLRGRNDGDRPFDFAQDRPFDFAQDRPFDPSTGLRAGSAQDRPFDPAQDKPWSACFRLWETTYITANGNVLPCCISPFSTTDYANLILGNVFQTPFAQIWNGAKYVKRRVALHTAQPLHPCELCGVSWSL